MALFPNPGPSVRRLKRLAVLFAHSHAFRPAMLLFLVLMGLLALQTWLTLANNGTNRDLFTAIERRDMGHYTLLAAVYVTVFLFLTFLDVAFRFVEERLGLLLRRGLT